jgi:hypothetical protein
LSVLGEFVDWLAGLPGRKALLYVSGGLSLEPGEALLRAWNAKFGQVVQGGEDPILQNRRLETAPLLARLAERANANRVTFYALGAPEAVGGISAEFAGNPEWTGGQLEQLEQDNKTGSLLALSADTGGLASLDAFKAGNLLERMQRDLDTYYSLGFTPGHPRDGKVHRLEVRTRDRALQVRHREAYRANSMAEAMSGRALAALTLDEGSSNPLAVSLEIGKPTPGKKGSITLPVLVKFGLSDLALVPHDAIYEGRVRVFVAARDERGRNSKVTEIRVPIRVPQEQLREVLAKQAGLVVNVQLRSGRHRMAVTVLDDVGKVSSTTTATYSPAGEAKAGREGR